MPFSSPQKFFSGGAVTRNFGNQPMEKISVRDRYLPPGGAERKAYLWLWALVLVLKGFIVFHYRGDPDETQHAHVVWARVMGHLQYRDLFDNHMPLFQIAWAPIMGMLGERADILVLLRWTMLPLFFVCAWAVFRLTETLFSRRIAPWVALAAACLPKFIYTSTEFRPDNLWAAFWLLGLLVAVSGSFTWKRAFWFGLMLGLTFATSLKTVMLLLALVAAALVAMALAWLDGGRPNFGAILRGAGKLGTILCAALIAPGLTFLYFAWQGAFWIMYYCVILHNIVPKMKRWGHFSLHLWYFPAAVMLLGMYGWLIFRQARDRGLAMKRTIVLLTPWLFLFLLLSYWPDITREDDLPYVPLTPLLAIPLILWLKSRFRFPQIEARFFTWVLPAVCFIELLCVWNLNPLRTDRLKVTTRSIRDVLMLTRPDQYVMDAIGNYVYRPRPTYWALETITKVRMRLGLIHEDLVSKLEKTDTTMCYLYSAHLLTQATAFILTNYIPFDPQALDLGVAGKKLDSPAADETYPFNVAIPATYAVVSESGNTTGTLDGAPYLGPVRLESGQHSFHRTGGTGRVAIFLAVALEHGFRPLFDASEHFLKRETAPGSKFH